jgi:hypothetical protein
MVVVVLAGACRFHFDALGSPSDDAIAGDTGGDDGVVPCDGADCACTTMHLDLEGYSAGVVNGQDGWQALGTAGMGCAVYDHQVAANTYGYPQFGATSMRASNAVTSGCFGDATFTKSLPYDAGESTAATGGASSGTRRPHFMAEFTIASTQAALQTGLDVEVDADQGVGARSVYVDFYDLAAGLSIDFADYQDVPPYGSPGNPAHGCGGGDGFVTTTIATGLPRTVPITIRIEIDYFEGPHNDVSRIYIDGALKHTGTTWEDYSRWCDATSLSITVDSLMIRTGGTAKPALAGKGFVIDNITLQSCM